MWLRYPNYLAEPLNGYAGYKCVVHVIKSDVSLRHFYEKRISEATSRLVLESRRADVARAERDDLLRRLRVASARADGATANPDRSYRAEYAQCRKVLGEGAELLAEADDLARRIAREKDALAEIVSR